MRLQVLEIAPGGAHELAQRARLVAEVVLDLLWRDVHDATAEAHEVRQARV